MASTLRLLTPDDYEAVARFYCEAGQFTTAEGIRYNDEHREAYCLYGRYLAEADGRVVGTARYRQDAGAYHPRHFDLKVLVLPEYRGQGIGTDLYRALLQALQPHDPLSFGTTVNEPEAAGIRFAQKHGFAEDLRQWEFLYDLTRPETAEQSAQFDAALARAAAVGYVIETFAEMAADPVRDRQVYEMLNELRRDVPSARPFTDIPWERWQESRTNPKFWHGGFFVARQGDDLVGMSQLWGTDEPSRLQTGLTAVRRASRGAGVATALKVRALRAARAAGYHTISTFNATHNREMLAVNEKLGFTRQPGNIHFSKRARIEG